MKKFIAILFIAVLCGTLLPGVIHYEKKQVVLFSTVEEEQQEQSKVIKEKEDTKALLAQDLYTLAANQVRAYYPNFSISFSDTPFLGIQTPPPDSSC